MRDWCATPEGSDSIEGSLQRALTELSARYEQAYDDATKPTTPRSPAATKGPLDAPPPSAIQILVTMSHRRIGELATTEAEALAAYGLLHCLVLLGDAAVAGVGEQLWTQVDNRHSTFQTMHD